MASEETTPKYCPCCHRPWPKPRIELLRPELARALQQIHAQAGLEFRKIPAYTFKAQHSRLKHWGFLEEELYVRKDGSQQRRPGVWRVTGLGEQWLAGYSRVPFELRLERDQVIGAGEQRVTIGDVLGLEDRDDTEWSEYERYMFGGEEGE